MIRVPTVPALLLVCVVALMMGCPAAATDSYRWSGVARVVAIGDVHGAFPEMVAMLREAGIIDAEHHWSGGTAHLVSLGDLLDRGDRSREVMDLLMALSGQAEAAGGRVHVVLGNHEVMNLSRDLRYVDADEFAQYADLDPAGAGDGRRGHQVAFASDGHYGRWLLSLPLVIAVNDTLFLHGGVSTDLLKHSLDQINQQGRSSLQGFVGGFKALVSAGLLSPDADFDAILDAGKTYREDPDIDPLLRAAASAIAAAPAALPFSQDGPLWYRGNALCHPWDEEPIVDRALAQFQVQRIVQGHSPTPDGVPHGRMQGKVLRVDTGMNKKAYGGTPAALELTEDGVNFLYATADKPHWVAETNRHWGRPYGMSDAQIEDFLGNAEVTRVEDLATGITNPKRLTLERSGKTMRAVFKQFDSDNNLENQRWSRTADKADRFVYDYLAYRLDRMLGLEMVPPAVLREVNGTPGVVQFWVEKAINEKERRAQDLPYQGVCSLRDQYNLMNVFDALIHNDDRNLSNVLFKRTDWRIWLIDHTRAFRSAKRVPKLYRDAEVTITAPMAEALQGLTRERLQEELGEFLHPRQVDGLVARIRYLVKLQ